MLLLLLVPFAAGGCARGRPEPVEPAHADFRAIQRQEARLAEGHAAVHRQMARTSPDCDRACAGADQVCEAAERICAVAEGVDDADAAERCRRGREACRAARTRAGERCSCAREGGS